MRHTIRTLLLCACVSPAASAEPATGFVSVGHGGVFAAGTFARSQSWLDLHCEGMDCQLRSTQPAIGRGSERNILDEDEPTAVVFFAGEPIAVFSGLPQLRNPVVTWGRQPIFTNPLSPARSTASEGVFNLPLGDARLRWHWQRSDDGESYRHSLSDGTRSQALFELSAAGHYDGDTSMPELHFIGDLDGDARVDLLLSLPDDNCGFDQRLYLSSLATPGEWLALAARFEGRWPACGC